MRGLAISTPTPTNYGAVGLFNDSKVGEVLILWALTYKSISQPLFWNAEGGGSEEIGTIGAYLLGYPSVAGKIAYKDMPDISPATYIDYDNSLTRFTFSEPIAVVKPNSTFWLVASPKATVFAACFIWSSLLPDEFRLLNAMQIE